MTKIIHDGANVFRLRDLNEEGIIRRKDIKSNPKLFEDNKDLEFIDKSKT